MITGKDRDLVVEAIRMLKESIGVLVDEGLDPDEELALVHALQDALAAPEPEVVAWGAVWTNGKVTNTITYPEVAEQWAKAGGTVVELIRKDS